MSKGYGESRSEWYRINQAERGQLTLLDEVSDISLDERGRLHSDEKPAIRWEDGLKSHFIEGVYFDPYTWEAIITGKITPDEAIHLTNAEQRRVAIKRVGINKMLSSLAAKPIDYWKDYVLYELHLYDDIEIRTEQHFGRRGSRTKIIREYLPAKFLRMVDSTTGQTYFLRVPSDAIKCQHAVAWTFGMESRHGPQYEPDVET